MLLPLRGLGEREVILGRVVAQSVGYHLSGSYIHSSSRSAHLHAQRGVLRLLGRCRLARSGGRYPLQRAGLLGFGGKHGESILQDLLRQGHLLH